MRRTIPEWQLTLVWFVASIGATGAFWYFMSAKKFYSALASAGGTVVLVAVAIGFSMKNERQKLAVAERHGIPGLKQRILLLAEQIDHFVTERRFLRREIETRGPEDREIYKFDLDTNRQFEHRFWNEVVLLRDRVGSEFAHGDSRLNQNPTGMHAIAELATGLRAVAAKLR